MAVFDNVKKNFGFGCMRLPTVGERIDREAFCRMIDTFMERGFNYFDTARMYHSGDSERALYDCLVSRYPRESYFLVNKLSGPYFETADDVRPLFEDQLSVMGVDYFDLYLMHSQHAGNYPKFRACRAYETAFELKREGKIRHVGLSFHDTPELLDRILTDYPEIECVQIQLNYVDFDDPVVEGGGCYEVCRKHGKPIIVMEPVKGGALVRLPERAASLLEEQKGGSVASYAIRYAASFEGVFMVLSGMSNDEQLADNLSFMENFVPLSDAEHALIREVTRIYRAENLIPCTGCAYCVDGCPASIRIPELISLLNSHKRGEDVSAAVREAKKGAFSDACVECGACENVCPQHLPIRRILSRITKTFR